MADISVAREDHNDERISFIVTVVEGGSETTHRVTVSQADFERLSRPNEPVEEFGRRCFEFLLARESKESILSAFDVSVISRYFPEFEQEIAS